MALVSPTLFSMWPRRFPTKSVLCVLSVLICLVPGTARSASSPDISCKRALPLDVLEELTGQTPHWIEHWHTLTNKDLAELAGTKQDLGYEEDLGRPFGALSCHYGDDEAFGYKGGKFDVKLGWLRVYWKTDRYPFDPKKHFDEMKPSSLTHDTDVVGSLGGADLPGLAGGAFFRCSPGFRKKIYVLSSNQKYYFEIWVHAQLDQKDQLDHLAKVRSIVSDIDKGLCSLSSPESHRLSVGQAIEKLRGDYCLMDALCLVELARQHDRIEIRRKFRSLLRSEIGDFDEQTLAAISHGLFATWAIHQVSPIPGIQNGTAIASKGFFMVLQSMVVVSYDALKWIVQGTTDPSENNFFNTPNTSKASWQSIAAGLQGTVSGISGNGCMESDPTVIAAWRAQGLLPSLAPKK